MKTKQNSGIYSIIITIMVLFLYWIAKKINIEDYFAVGMITFILAIIRYKMYEAESDK